MSGRPRSRKSCVRCHKIKEIWNRDPMLCRGCYDVWVNWGRPDTIPIPGAIKPDDRTIHGIADYLTVLREDPKVYGKLGGIRMDYVAERIGVSERTAIRYRAKVRDNDPAVDWAKRLLV